MLTATCKVLQSLRAPLRCLQAVNVNWEAENTNYDQAKASRRSDYYFAFFLCYPSMTQSFINHFNCRRLSPTLWVLQKDYSEQCYEGWCAATVQITTLDRGTGCSVHLREN